MAPRTKEQQAEYNAKRRAETAAKKNTNTELMRRAQAANPAKKIKPSPQSQSIASGRPTATFIVPKAHLDKIAKLAGVKPGKLSREKHHAATRKVGKSPNLAAKFAVKTPSAKPIKGVDAAPVDKLMERSIQRRDAAHAKQLASEAEGLAKASVPERKTARIPNAAMAGAYFRGGAPGEGLKRGKNFQATVTFTPEQFAELRDKALFNQRSLAEQIRWSVIQTLRSLA